MKKPLITLFVLITILLLSGCAIRTPQINGIVLDEETKQPVPDAWVTGMITIEYSTVAGKGLQYISIVPPHTRTDKDGKFIVQSGKYKGATFPFEFGNNVKHFGVGATTFDDRGGSISLMESLGKKKIDVTIYIKPEFTNSTESEYFTYLQSLYNYCLTGRFSVEVPAVEGGCDDWELDYVINKHDKLLKMLKHPFNSDQKSIYANTLNQLGYLYKKKNEINKSINIYKQLMDFDGKNGWFYNSSKNRIKELQKQLDQNPIK